jgi:drug/metabolite transporter (DMT)-like permease
MNSLARVILWMTGALVSFSVMAVSVRALAARELSIFEILAIRTAFSLLVFVLLLLLRSELRPLVRPRRMGLHLVRNISHYGALYCWSLALTLLPLATVFSLEFTMPAWTALLAVWLLGERLTASRIGVVIFGLIGVLVILRPNAGSVNPAAFLVLIAAFGYAASAIATKKLTATDSTFAIVFWMAVIQLPLSLAGSDIAMVGRLESGHLLPALGVGLAGLTSHYCLTNAFRAGDATVVQPLDFLRIPLIALVGWAFYNEALDLYVLLGAGIIISGILWNLHAESIRFRH